ncbi:MAG: NUDIX hydrolase [Armatimonadetes bacterium]|nr:NUDIX hydrolase [Armatimonadota bacterium]
MPNPSDPEFPTAVLSEGRLDFFPVPFQPPAPTFAVVVFAWQEESVLLAEIPGRGWCVPSGRVEIGERPDQTAIRETFEETGAVIAPPSLIGYNRWESVGSALRWVAVFAARVESLGSIPKGSESAGRSLCPLAGLPKTYYLWNPLTEAVFRYSLSCLADLPR